MSEADATARALPTHALREAFDRSAREAMRPACATLAALYVVFTFAHHTQLPRAAALVMVPLTLAGLAVVLAMRAWAPRVPAGRAHVFLFALGAIAVSNSLTLLAVTGEPKQTTNIILLAVACGYVLLDSRYVAAFLALTVAGWTGIALASPPSPDWTHFTFAMISGLALATLVHLLRVRHATRLEMHQRALEASARAAAESEARLRAVVEGAPLALCAVDADARITLLEGQWLAKLPCDARTLVGRSVLDVCAGEPNLVEAAQRALAGEPATALVANDEWALEVRWRPAAGGGAVAVAFDVSDRQRMQATRDELARMREVDELKTQFMNHAAHELATPLTPLRLQVALLRHAKDDAARAKGLDLLERNVLRLQRLVGDLLDSSRLQAHRLSLRREPVDLRRSAVEAVDGFLPAAQAAGVHLVLDAPEELPAEADPGRLHQVLTNLLSNALKFTPVGGRIVVRARAGGDGHAQLSVTDSGVGMAREDAARLFQPFTQLEAGAAKGGTGLGLHISRGLVELHGGRVWCESDGPGRGATFAFTVPLTATAQGRSPEATRPSPA